MADVSIIIPCYNVEHFIRDCLNSVLEQTLQDKEVICIDDGSTDNTQNILMEYKEKADIVVLHQKNQGSGTARNRGISASAGKYMAFMDADDFYPARDTLEKIYLTAQNEKAEICGGSGCTFRNGVYTYSGFRKGFVFERDGWISREDFPTVNGYWRFIYKSDFIRDNQISFPNYLRCQDAPFFLHAILCAGRVYCMREVTYVYRKEHKQVFFTQKQAVDYAKGMRDSLKLSTKGGMIPLQGQILNELRGELSAMMYLYAESSAEMRDIIREFNDIIANGNTGEPQFWMLKEGKEIAVYVENVREEIRRLLEELKAEKHVLIYGAGTVGKRVRAFLMENNVLPEAFVVSDIRQNAISLDGLPVKCIDDYVDQKDECMVIVATFPYLHEEIQNTLQEKEFKKVYTLSVEKLHLFSGEVIH